MKLFEDFPEDCGTIWLLAGVTEFVNRNVLGCCSLITCAEPGCTAKGCGLINASVLDVVDLSDVALLSVVSLVIKIDKSKIHTKLAKQIDHFRICSCPGLSECFEVNGYFKKGGGCEQR